MRRLLQMLVAISTIISLVLSVVLAMHQVKPMQAQQKGTVLRMAVPYAPEHPTAQAAVTFAKRVKQETDGEIEIQVFFETTLGTKTELLEQLQFGGVAFAVVDSIVIGDQLPILAKLLQASKGSEPEEMVALLHRRQSNLKTAFDKEQIQPLAIYMPDYRVIATTQPVEKQSDFAQRRLYHPGTLALQNGAQAVQMELADLFDTLDNDFVEGAELSLLEYTQASYFAVLPYVLVQNSVVASDLLLASNASLGALRTEQQKLLQVLASETIQAQAQALQAAQLQAIRRLKQRQVQLYPHRLQQTMPEHWPMELKKTPWLTGGEESA